ncbi:response regulator [Paeniglutamicibacter psychrophenolicus]|uniref:Pilus assembly protein CpaE n=1 Tax=Paeniglutamicibacter psychrophenolicus TaxID=257454 RepID=A0ABS4WJ39_9MICC|nr:AAA family ATPase [Paeniglutamicibacter psychrophenolicus]MBP2376046.1 pilus assembly protein CpaE [Paeniglutamicibacter psychrophenolicus]
MSRFLLLTDLPDFEKVVELAIRGALPGNLQRIPAAAVQLTPEELLTRSLGEITDVLLLGPDVNTAAALDLATAMDLLHPDISVVLTASGDSELVMTAMRAGIRDIADPGAEPEQLRVLLERNCLITESRRRQTGDGIHERQRGRVIAVMSPKGGVGKTTIATNLAVGLSKIAPMGVVILDLDLQFGDVSSALNLDPEHTITDAVFGAAAQDSMVLKAYLSVGESGVYALCGPKNPADADLITAEQVAILVSQLAAEFQYVVLDTAPGLGEHLLAALELTTDAVWVCGMDVPSIRGLNNGLAVLRELQLIPEGRHVVLNFADKRNGLTVQDIELSIGLPVDAVIPVSRSVSLSTNKGIPLLAEKTRGPAWRNLHRFALRFDPSSKDSQRKSVHRREVLQ